MVEELQIAEEFQQTDAGIIPNDWVVKPLHEVAHFENGKAHEQFIDEYGDYIVVNSKFISTEGRVRKFSKKNIFPLKKGNITIVMSDIPKGKALAKCFLIDKDNTYTLNQRIGGITANDDTDNRYLFYKLNRNKYYLAFDSGTGQTNIKRQEILDCPIALPPLKSEQTAIATALRDTESLIAGIEKLLSKKLKIKEGIIQKLLTKKEYWGENSLGSMTVAISSGKSSTKSKSDKYPIHGSTGVIGWSNHYDYEGPKILVARVGANAGTVNKVSGRYCVSDNTLMISLKPELDLDFLFYKLISFNLNSIVFGSGQPLITGSQLKNLTIQYPKEKSEQTEITAIISDLEIEINQIKRLHSKYIKVKQGMLQELLSGKTRLI